MLEVDSTATTDELRQAFRRQTLKWHPDVSNATNAAEKFESIKLAYETLRNAEKRTKYINKRLQEQGGQEKQATTTDIVPATADVVEQQQQQQQQQQQKKQKKQKKQQKQ